MNIIVFLGPSLSLRDAATLLPEADFRPPARSGDITRAALEQPKAIVLIDGLFEQVRSVRHKEILFALSEGIHVYGASSMGALRAAELAAFGMVGVGRIFEKFATGAWEDDDEVTVSHASAEFSHRSLSEAMANLRFGLQDARDADIIDESQRARLEALAKQMFYGDRSWAALFEAALAAEVDSGAVARLKRFVTETQPNAKRGDAVMVLQRVRDDMATGLGPFKAGFDFEGTRDFRNPILIDAESARALERRTARGILLSDLANYIRIWGSPDLDEIRSAALEILPQEGPPGRGRRERAVATAFEVVGPLGVRDPVSAWRAVSTADVLDQFMVGIRRKHADAMLPIAAYHDERIIDLHERLAKRTEVLATMRMTDSPIERTGLSVTDLLTWYAEQRSFEPEALDQWVATRGVDSEEILLRHVIDEFLFIRLEDSDDTA
jgi:hypothetical protein